MNLARSLINMARQRNTKSRRTRAREQTSECPSWNTLVISEDHPTRVLTMLCKQRVEKPEFCDLKLTSADGVSYPCHRAVLASQSDLICSLLENDPREFGGEIEVPQRAEDLDVLLEYIYSGTMEIEEGNCWRLYSAICFFRLRDTYIRDEIFNVLVRLLKDEDNTFLNSADFLNIQLHDMPRLVDVLMQTATVLGSNCQARVLQALGKWADDDFIRRGQFFLEIERYYKVAPMAVR